MFIKDIVSWDGYLLKDILVLFLCVWKVFKTFITIFLWFNVDVTVLLASMKLLTNS